MTPDRQTILSQALKLAEPDREVLVDELLASLKTANEGGPSSPWADVVAQRLSEIDAGQVAMVPGDQVMAKLRAMTNGRSR